MVHVYKSAFQIAQIKSNGGFQIAQNEGNSLVVIV